MSIYYCFRNDICLKIYNIRLYCLVNLVVIYKFVELGFFKFFDEKMFVIIILILFGVNV